MNVTLRIWRQRNHEDQRTMVSYQINDISPDMSFLEMLDVLNEQLTHTGDDPVAFDHDCREGICGMCSLMINGLAHGPEALTATCQLYMRHFADGEVIDIEPWRSSAFPVLKDLVVDRSALDRIVQAGGYISVPTGQRPTPMPRPWTKEPPTGRLTQPHASAAVPTLRPAPMALLHCSSGPKLLIWASLPQGPPERDSRALSMVDQHDTERFGGCTQIGECTAVCPAGIPLDMISQLNHDVLSAMTQKYT